KQEGDKGGRNNPKQIIQKLPPTEAEKLLVQLVTVLKSQQPGIPNITPAERRALNTLTKVDNIVITKANKGKAAVAMNKSDYLQVKQHPAEDPYRVIDNANITSIMNRNKAEVGKYLRSVMNHIGEGNWYPLYPKSAIQARLYGLPKIHKPDIPVRPIVNGKGSPPHELARFLAGILKPLTGKSSTYIKYSYDFANKVAGVTVEPDDILGSLSSLVIPKQTMKPQLMLAYASKAA
ncbi:hypothetical protein T265_15652, partial [Opisthorchis viverrini]